jgi:hypothetical protein
MTLLLAPVSKMAIPVVCAHGLVDRLAKHSASGCEVFWQRLLFGFLCMLAGSGILSLSPLILPLYPNLYFGRRDSRKRMAW